MAAHDNGIFLRDSVAIVASAHLGRIVGAAGPLPL
jgi:hypothetical protein